MKKIKKNIQFFTFFDDRVFWFLVIFFLWWSVTEQTKKNDTPKTEQKTHQKKEVKN
jgi:hypothetical protein